MITEKETKSGEIPVVAGGISPAYYHNAYNRQANVITISASGANAGFVNYFDIPIWASDCSTITSTDSNKTNIRYVYELLKTKQDSIYYSQKGKSQPHIYPEDIGEYKLPFPDIDIQNKIIDEITPLSNFENEAAIKIKELTERIELKYNSLYIGAEEFIRLSDSNTFNLSIGRRVLNTEVLTTGEVPVYSANVFKPFGFFNKLLITDFSQKSVVWGIDGDWMVNTIDKNIPFYPTDHCGVLRLNNNTALLEDYVAYALKKEGDKYGFSRNKRASIDRIKAIRIPVPDIKKQKKVVAEILSLKSEIEDLQQSLDEIPARKQAILDKYLK